ncbi:hypothetical protein FIV42_23485 [Persicimonas caeni]|uniref:Uncharacterized protein n=1 Tax=Persicimonas caeni TaxID=2292766 RepID=A0A4Y6Q022_PERCE|nr:hypothetical protein [Persicimonas caeni]QDG53597.1 hypothetical protein FIV42_23485 [Persicimonas caeni]QED34818.1 hypothetical protein FRD00_23480 [Persicimonas caeni]
MWEPPWKRLVERLKAEDFESTYLDRLDRRLSIAAGSNTLEKEIIEEMAYALTKSGDKINVALLELDVLRRDYDNASDPAERARLADGFNEKRREAMRARWELMVHREALGFLRHDGIEEDFPIPPQLGALKQIG